LLESLERRLSFVHFGVRFLRLHLKDCTPWKESDMDEDDLTAEEGAEVPDIFLAVIGRVSVKWNLLDMFLNLTLTKLMGAQLSDSRPVIVITHMAFPHKVDAFSALIVELLPTNPRLAEYKSMLIDLRAAQKERNWVSHSIWGAKKDGTVTIAKISARGELKTSVTAITIKEVQAASAVIQRASEHLYDFLSVSHWLDASRTKGSRRKLGLVPSPLHPLQSSNQLRHIGDTALRPVPICARMFCVRLAALSRYPQSRSLSHGQSSK
jgi:hypothetical protein